MRADPIHSAVRVTNPIVTYPLKTSPGDYLILDQAAKLEQAAPLRSS